MKQTNISDFEPGSIQCDDCKGRPSDPWNPDPPEFHWCRENSIWQCSDCIEAHARQGALDAGIPLSVIEGQTKLSDHFSAEYINHMSNREVKRETD